MATITVADIKRAIEGLADDDAIMLYVGVEGVAGEPMIAELTSVGTWERELLGLKGLDITAQVEFAEYASNAALAQVSPELLRMVAETGEPISDTDF